jgi:predicted dehydrogenase
MDEKSDPNIEALRRRNRAALALSAERVRKLRLFARDSYFSVDYAEQSVSSARLVRGGPAPQIAPQVVEVVSREPLAAELDAFVARCRGERAPTVDGRTGTEALRAAIRVRESVEAR